MSKSLNLRTKNTVFSINMLVSICIGVFLLTWNHVFNLVLYNLSVGSLSFKEMGSIFLDDIYGSHARSGFDLFAPILAVLPATTLFCELQQWIYEINSWQSRKKAIHKRNNDLLYDCRRSCDFYPKPDQQHFLYCQWKAEYR